MEFLIEYGMFLAKAITILVVVLAAAAGLIALSTRSTGTKPRERIEVKNLNERYRAMTRTLRAAMMPHTMAKKALRTERRRRKAEDKQRKRHPEERRRIFVLDFHGDIRASALSSLREEITAVLTVATPRDEVLVRLESGGGMVHAYGLAASQLQRLREHKIPLTVAVDKVAASGGYMMACVADRILAAPFAVLGSIGVLAQLPNFHRLLKRHDVDFEQITAGEFKRTLTLFGENTEVARHKLREEVEDIHALFKEFVHRYRPQMDIERVATGEHWHAARALEMQLVDELRTSDDYLLAASAEADLFELHFVARRPLANRLRALTARLLGRHPGAWDEGAEPGSTTLL